MPTTAIARLRVIGIIEGVSFLLLLGVAMPLKYLAGMPLAVTVVGAIHGILFVAFCVALNNARIAHNWKAKRVGTVFLAGLLPGGPFLIDRHLREEDIGTAAGSDG